METVTYKGYQIRIEHDEDACNPLEDFIDIPRFYCFHSRYRLGHPHKLEVSDVLELVADASSLCLPLYLYDHSGITISSKPFACPWDSGHIGYAVMTEKNIRDEWSGDREKALKYMQGQISTYDDYLCGNIYSFTVSKDGWTVDSCGGFYGYDHEENGLLEATREAIDRELKSDAEYHAMV